MDIRRRLAAQNPDAYEPDLAGSLAVLAHCLEENGDLDGAVERNREAVAIYAPFFLAMPQAFVHWMMPMRHQYVDRCERLGREPDAELLRPIAEALRALQSEAGHEEGT